MGLIVCTQIEQQPIWWNSEHLNSIIEIVIQ